MKTLFYSTKDFELDYLQDALKPDITATFIPAALGMDTVELAKGFEAVSVFTGDDCKGDVIRSLSAAGVKFIAIRSAGYDNIDIPVCNEWGIRVANVPEYSPNAIAEHSVALMLALDRQLIRA